jgi:hypothetical protein
MVDGSSGPCVGAWRRTSVVMECGVIRAMAEFMVSSDGGWVERSLCWRVASYQRGDGV